VKHDTLRVRVGHETAMTPLQLWHRLGRTEVEEVLRLERARAAEAARAKAAEAAAARAKAAEAAAAAEAAEAAATEAAEAAAAAEEAERLQMEEEATVLTLRMESDALRLQQIQVRLGVVRPPPGPANEALCVVCLDAPKEYIVLPCLHMCACEACAQKLLKLRTPCCPVCRGPIQRIGQVFS